MGIVVVTGMGPRTGTSFVMQEAVKAGLPVKGIQFPLYTIPAHNYYGYWEAPFTMPVNGIVKLWTPDLIKIPHSQIDRVVVLERKDKLAQVYSMYKVFKDECKLFPELAKHFTTADVLHKNNKQLNFWLNQRDKQTILRVFTEDLNDLIGDVLCFIERG